MELDKKKGFAYNQKCYSFRLQTNLSVLNGEADTEECMDRLYEVETFSDIMQVIAGTVAYKLRGGVLGGITGKNRDGRNAYSLFYSSLETYEHSPEREISTTRLRSDPLPELP